MTPRDAIHVWSGIRVLRLAPLAAVIALAQIPAGCGSDPTRGYTFGGTGRPEVRSVAVPIFENSTFSKGLEVQLTDAVVKEIQRTTPWAVTSRDRAQTVLVGTITGSELRPLTRVRREGYVQEMAVRVFVDFEWRDARTGRVIAGRRGLSASETFVPSRPAAEPIEIGQYAAVQEMAKLIVTEMRTNW